MPSPKSGSAGSLVKPTAPKEAKEASKDKTGSNTTTSNSGSKEGGAGSVVKVDDPPEHKPEENKDKTSWIELQMVYESNGLPVAGMSYAVTLPDGKTIASGSTDDQGNARVQGIDPGSCQISFPLLDKDAWDDA